MQPCAALLQRTVLTKYDTDLVNSVVQELGKPDAVLPCDAEDMYLAVVDHLVSCSLASDTDATRSIRTLLLTAATTLLTSYCHFALQLPPSAAEQAANTSLIVQVVEAHARDQIPAKTLLAVAIMTSSNSLQPTLLDALVSKYPPPHNAIPTIVQAYAYELAGLLRPWLLTPPRNPDVLLPAEQQEIPLGHRLTAAHCVSWILLSHPPHHPTTPLASSMMPLVLRILRDPSPEVRTHAAHIIHSLCTQGVMPGCLDGRLREALLEGCCQAVQGTEGLVWGDMANAACALAIACAGKPSNPRSPALLTVMGVMLTMGELRTHVLTMARAWLHAATPLVRAMGIHVLAVFSRLLPLLLGWVGSSHDALQVDALRTLLVLISTTWPRMRAHAGVVRMVVCECRDRVGAAEETKEVAGCVLEALDACCRGGGEGGALITAA